MYFLTFKERFSSVPAPIEDCLRYFIGAGARQKPKACLPGGCHAVIHNQSVAASPTPLFALTLEGQAV